MQNRSHAVMAQRSEARDSLDDFPTPAWATRALIKHVLYGHSLSGMSCLEPACGRGHMARALGESFGRVHSSDVFDYGFGEQRDFLLNPLPENSFDWVITNPPFRLAQEFFLRAFPIARHGIAFFERTVFLESVGRYERLFRHHPPSIFAQFVERVPIVSGRLDRNASTATGYSWFVWEKNQPGELRFIPPCRKELERDSDYELTERPRNVRVPNVGSAPPDLFASSSSTDVAAVEATSKANVILQSRGRTRR